MSQTSALIEKIKSSLDLVELIREHLPLKQAGRNFKTLCPFHAEKSPSFMVNRDKQIFHCFGCGAGGDGVTFLMKHENLSFMEALKILAQRAGINMPEASSPESAQTAKLYETMEVAAQFYERHLFTAEGKIAFNYLIKRGLTQAEIKKFRLGLAPSAWDSLYKFLGAKGISPREMTGAGLIIKKVSAGYYDRFRERLIFPIMNSGNKVIALGGRIINQGEPKYLNSPETPIYHKGLVLYGLNLARTAIAKEKKVMVVEGYLDLISLFQFGFDYSVATLGTALTPMQLKLLQKFSPELILAYDADSGGEGAVCRGMETALRLGFSLRVLELPAEDDPEDFLRREGREAMAGLLKNAPDFFDFRRKILERRLSPRHPREKTKIVQDLLALLKVMPGQVEAMLYLKRLAEHYAIPEESLRLEFKNLKASPDEIRLAAYPAGRPGFSREREVMKIILAGGELSFKARRHLRPDDFSDENLKKIMAEVLKLRPEEELKAKDLLNLAEEDGWPSLITGLSLEESQGPDPENVLEEFILKIMYLRREQKARRLLAEIKREEEAGNVAAVKARQREYEELIRRKEGRPIVEAGKNK